MSTLLYPEVGIQQPAQLGYSQSAGSIVRVTNGATPYSLGHVMRLTPGSSLATTYADFDPGAFDFSTISVPTVPAATDVGADTQSATFGVLLQDLAANESGFVMVRGLCLAMVDVITTNLSLDGGMYVGDGATANTLQNIKDAGTGDNVKIIGRSRYTSNIADATAIGTFPVLFNGVEGFGWHVGV